MEYIKKPVCINCKNLNKSQKIYNCKAFNNIPDEIITGANNHSTPLEGQDNSIVFELIDEQQSTNFNN